VVEYLLTLHAAPATLFGALCRAALSGHTAVCRLLILSGADPSQRETAPLRDAVLQSRAEVVELLLQDPRVKAVLEVAGRTRKFLIEYAAKRGVAVLRAFLLSGTASRGDVEEVLQVIAKKGVEIDASSLRELQHFQEICHD
ncbi:hypothetical protein HK405_002143, partial [Cladochytrium tenue]